jgi:hypothetical protein
MAQPVQDHRLQRTEPEIEAIATGAAVAGGRAAEQVGTYLDVAGAALAALGEAGDEKAPALPCSERLLPQIRSRVPFDHLLALFDGVPVILRNNAQLRNLLHDPTIAIIEPGNALPCFRILDVAQPVPDEPADIELVVENAGAARGVAVDRRGILRRRPVE